MSSENAIYIVEVITIVISSLSVIFPLSVVIILIQRYNSLVMGKSLTHYILMIAIADTMTAMSMALGYPRSGTTLCSFQGFALLFSARMSWFFTDVLIFQLFYVVVFHRFFLNVKYMHCIVWSLNILLQLLPFTTGTSYGNYDDEFAGTACSLSIGKGTVEDAIKWFQYTFNIELLISFGIIIILSSIVVFYSILNKRIEPSQGFLTRRIRDSWSIVILYPLALLVTWIPSTAFSIYLNSTLENSTRIVDHLMVISNYLSAINALYGPLLALIFYSKTVESRQAWMSNLDRFISMIMMKNVPINDNRTTCSSIISIDDRYINGTETSGNSAIFRMTRGSSLFGRDTTTTCTANKLPISNPMNNVCVVRIEEDL